MNNLVLVIIRNGVKNLNIVFIIQCIGCLNSSIYNISFLCQSINMYCICFLFICSAGHYLYIKGSSTHKSANILSPLMTASESRCLSLWMYGKNCSEGSVSISLRDEQGITVPIITLSPQELWTKARYPLSLISLDKFQVHLS